MELSGYLSPSQSLSGNLTTIIPPAFKWTLLASKTLFAHATSSSAAIIGTITAADAWTSDKIIMVRVRDNAGRRNGYFLESDTFFINKNPSEGSTTTATLHLTQTFRVSDSGVLYTSTSSTPSGIYADSLASDGVITLKGRVSTNETVYGSYAIEVWALDWPDGADPF